MMRPSVPTYFLKAPCSLVSGSLVFYSNIVPLLYTPTDRWQLAPDDRANCAQAFSLHLLQQDRLAASPSSPAFLQRCAVNFVRNFRRDRMRLLRHEVPWPQQTDEDGRAADREFSANLPCLDAPLMQQEAHTILYTALRRLPPTQQKYAIRHFFHDASYADIAAAFHTTPDAARMTITRALQRLRKILLAQGRTEAEMCGYLTEIGARGGGRRSKSKSTGRTRKTLKKVQKSGKHPFVLAGLWCYRE